MGFSRAVRIGGRVLVSGTAPIWSDGSCDPDPGVQAGRCLEIILAALARSRGRAGARRQDAELPRGSRRRSGRLACPRARLRRDPAGEHDGRGGRPAGSALEGRDGGRGDPRPWRSIGSSPREPRWRWAPGWRWVPGSRQVPGWRPAPVWVQGVGTAVASHRPASRRVGTVGHPEAGRLDDPARTRPVIRRPDGSRRGHRLGQVALRGPGAARSLGCGRSGRQRRSDGTGCRARSHRRSCDRRRSRCRRRARTLRQGPPLRPTGAGSSVPATCGAVAADAVPGSALGAAGSWTVASFGRVSGVVPGLGAGGSVAGVPWAAAGVGPVVGSGGEVWSVTRGLLVVVLSYRSRPSPEGRAGRRLTQREGHFAA